MHRYVVTHGAEVEAAPQAPSRPKNYTRNIFHVSCALSVLILIELILSPTGMVVVAGTAAAMAWTAEITRRRSARINRLMMWIFKRVAHPHEHEQVNSATWYTTALLGLALLGSKPVAAVAVIVLGFGDPAAAIIGRRFGATRLANGRSLEGSATFVLVGAAFAFGTLRLFHPELAAGPALALAFAGALVGAVAELLSDRVDDNLSIPVSVGLCAFALAPLLGLTL